MFYTIIRIYHLHGKMLRTMIERTSTQQGNRPIIILLRQRTKQFQQYHSIMSGMLTIVYYTLKGSELRWRRFRRVTNSMSWTAVTTVFRAGQFSTYTTISTKFKWSHTHIHTYYCRSVWENFD